ncbi:hypothetical protein KR032_008978, partial [Drosophila birchii]
SSGDQTAEVPSFKSESYGVPITFATPRSREALLDLMVAAIRAKDLRTCSTLVICQQNAEARIVKSEMEKHNINTTLLDGDLLTTQHMVRLWSQGYIQQVLIACDDHLKLLEGIPVNFVIHTALPPVDKFKERLSIVTKSENKAEMLAFILCGPKEEIRSLESPSVTEKNGKVPKLVVKPLNKNKKQEEASDMAWNTRALTRKSGSTEDVPAKTPEEPEIEGWQTPPEVATAFVDPVGSIRRRMEVILEARSSPPYPKGSSIDSAGSTKDQSSKAALEGEGMTQAQFGVLAWSRDLIIPCYGLGGVLDLNPLIRDTMMEMIEDMRDHQARAIQRYAWPHVSCGKSLVVVGPEKIGKTWCFLPSLCQRTHEQMLLRSEGHYGPTSIVVCFNHQEGKQILQWIIRLLRPLSTEACIPYKQVVTLWDKSNVLAVADRLSHPVGILVTTPEMLALLKDLDTKKSPIFDANSIKCLALDNLSTMMRHQPHTMAKMVDWIIQLLDFGSDGCQLFVTTRLWPDALMRESLLSRVPDVLIIFKDPLEATIFGKASLEVNLIRPGQESHSLVQMLRDRCLSEQRTVVVCHTKEEVLDIKSKLTKAGIRAEGIYADGGLSMVSQWRLRRLALVLLITDDMVNKVKCGRIDQLIHYNSSVTWMKFKFRFSLLYNNYLSSVEGSPGKSVVLLHQTDFDRIWLLADFMMWHQQPRPDHLLGVLAESRLMKGKQSSQQANLSLCEHISRYGDCIRRTCRYRHVMWREEVQPPANYLTDGHFRFQVLTCNSPAHIAIRLNELYPTKVTLFNTPMSELCHEMHMYYNLEQNRRWHAEAKVGEIVIVRNLKRYERAIVTEKDNNKIIVRLLDTGIDILGYNPNQIFVCEKRHQNEPCQAMEVCLIGIEPDTLDRCWTKDIRDVVRTDFFKRQGDNQPRIFSARVKLVLSRTIFVETVVDDKGQDLRSFLLDRIRVFEEVMSTEKLMRIVNASQPCPKN